MDANLKKIAKLVTEECSRLTMEDISVYDVEGRSPLTDMVVIATAAHILQLDAARSSLAFIGKQNGLPLKNPTEDYSEGWLAMDHGDYVVHILTPEKRAYYRLDDLMQGIKSSREKAEEAPEEEGGEAPRLSEEELLKLNAEFDFLTEDEISSLPSKKKK